MALVLDQEEARLEDDLVGVHPTKGFHGLDRPGCAIGDNIDDLENNL